MLSLDNLLLEKLNSLVLVFDKQGNVNYVSPSVKRILGYEPEHLKGEGWLRITKSNDAERTETKNFISSVLFKHNENDSMQFERQIKNSRGNYRWILYTSAKHTEETTVLFGQDITDRKNMELRLRKQHEEIVFRNKEITDSIDYAKNIQQAILPDLSKLKESVSDSFVLYQPKDVVSGDFYFTYKTNEYLFVAVADCTGHGVPGAMMSVLGHTALNEVIIKQGLIDTSKIVEALDLEIFNLLNKQNGEQVIQDGMDISLCRFDLKSKELEFTGALRPITVIKKTGELIEIRGSRFPIGFYKDFEKQFVKEVLQLEKGDRVYLFTDGYIDQFGGEKHKKLNRRGFYEILSQSQSMTMDEQESYLEYAFNNWKQDNEQIDDVCVLGIEI